jgi:cytochrome c553
MFDIAGVLILIALIALFGFLTTRAWKLKNAFLKWGGVSVCVLLTLVPAALLVLGLSGFAKLNEPHANPVADIQVAKTADQIARGEQLAHICVSCHTTDNRLPLSGTDFGGKFGMPPMGTLYAPNLTPGGDIDGWTDGEVIRAIREGVHQNGRSLLVMPAEDFRNLSDDDVQALVAYLRSQPATGGPTPTNQFNLLGAIFMNLSDFRTAQQPVSNVTAPQLGTSAYGKYVVDILGCRDCHGDQLQGKVDNGQLGPPSGPNLTKLVPQWTEEQFMTFFNTGTLPNGATVPTLTLPSGLSEPRMPWPMVRAATTDDELQAMYAYLHSLSTVDNPTK